MTTEIKNTPFHKNDYFTIKKLCETLSISEATAKNWIKSGKIKPTYTNGSTMYFSKDYIDYIVYEFKSKNSRVLKTRRNKKYITGLYFYENYISAYSKNLDSIIKLFDYITKEKLVLSENEIKYILADCSIQLLLQCKKINHNTSNRFLYEYLRGNVTLNFYKKLTDDLIDNKKEAIEFIKKYPELFKNKYIYEKKEDILGLLYISLSNLNNRKSKGVYYTPTKIVQTIINTANFDKSKNQKVLDPSCGSGNFLLHLPQNISVENVFGNDIDCTAIKITRINMALKFEISNTDILYKNFTNKDFLLDELDEKFDFIIGNPPWGARFTPQIKDELAKMYITAKNKNIESYNLFIEKSLNYLKQNGYLCFVLPEAILSVKNHKKIRSLISKKTSITYLQFLGNIFNKVQCPSIILKLKNTNMPLSCIGMKVVNGKKDFTIKQERAITPEVFSFSLTDEEYTVYQKIITNKNMLYLKDNAIFALGIVTGDNKKYISNTQTSDNEIILKGSDIKKFKICPSKTFIKYSPENFQQVAPTKYYRAKEKLFYKFISKKLVFAYDNHQILSLNSCNILIPKLKGYNIKYILAILNSKIAQFIFEKKYNSIKVLRSHVEGIPIPKCTKEKQDEIIKITNKIINNNNNCPELYETLEEKIQKLYSLKNNEYHIIN